MGRRGEGGGNALSGPLHVPGLLKCPKCSFTLQRNLMDGTTGVVSVNTEPTIEECPNDQEILQPVTWKEHSEMLAVVGNGQVERAVKAEEEIDRLKAAIRLHRDQRGDDRCWLDDLQLYAALGEPIKPDNRVGDKDAMLKNCARFIERRCEGGAWPSYHDLENALREIIGLDQKGSSEYRIAKRVLAWKER